MSRRYSNNKQILTADQRTEVYRIFRYQILKWGGLLLAIYTAITGAGLWQINVKLHEQLQATLAKQFEEPAIRNTLKEVASEKAVDLLQKFVQPDIDNFKNEIALRLAKLDELDKETGALEAKSVESEKEIKGILTSLQDALKDGESTRDKLVGMESDIIKIEKCLMVIQYYNLKGRGQFPNPYHEKIVSALNEMLTVAIPDPAERAKFVTELEKE